MINDNEAHSFGDCIFDKSTAKAVSCAALRSAREQGLNVARVESVREYSYANNPPRGVEVRMQVSRDATTVNTEPRTCRFLYPNGTADISRT